MGRSAARAQWRDFECGWTVNLPPILSPREGLPVLLSLLPDRLRSLGGAEEGRDATSSGTQRDCRSSNRQKRQHFGLSRDSDTHWRSLSRVVSFSLR